MTDDLFLDDAPGEDWLEPELAGMPPRPARGYAICSLAWLGRVLPVVRSPGQLAVALAVYSKCCRQRRRTVALSNRELRLFGYTRYAKYRALIWLQDAGVLTVEPENGRSIRVTLRWFP